VAHFDTIFIRSCRLNASQSSVQQLFRWARPRSKIEWVAQREKPARRVLLLCLRAMPGNALSADRAGLWRQCCYRIGFEPVWVWAMAGTDTHANCCATRGSPCCYPMPPATRSADGMDLAKTDIAGVDRLLRWESPNADRIGVWGHSYGGYSAFSAGSFKPSASSAGRGRLSEWRIYLGIRTNGLRMDRLPDSSHRAGATGLNGRDSLAVFKRGIFENSPIFLNLDRRCDSAC